LGQTRRHLLETVDRPALKSLPAEPYGLAEWRIRRVGIDYHVEVDNHFYSVPHRYARAEVEVRFTARTVEVFLRGERIATHRRGSGDGKHTTLPDHMPSSHRRYADWTMERIAREADAIGPSVSILCTLILERRPHPEQGFRACLGILRLARSIPAGRLDAAASRAIEIGALTYGSVKSILDNKLDQLAADPRSAEHQPVRHRNIRGGGYFH
jgi:transposase